MPETHAWATLEDLVCGPNLDPEFLMYLFMASRKHIREMGSGATHHSIYFPAVEAFNVCIPAIQEQRRIVEHLKVTLAEAGRARGAAQERLAAAEALPGAYLREVFDSNKWPVQSLGDGLAAIESGTSVLSHERPATETEVGVLKVSAISWGQFRPAENKAVPPDYRPDPREKVQPGDFLISRCNTSELVGAVVLVRDTPPNLMLSDKTLRLVLKPNSYQPAFLEQALRSRSARKFIEGYATGTSASMRNISQDTIRAIPVPTPTPDEQGRIATALSRRLEAGEALIRRCREEIEAINSLPAALLRAAFVGTP